MIRNKAEFEAAGGKYVVRKPDAQTRLRASVVHAKAFRDAITGGAILRERVTDALEEQGLLDDKKRREIEEIQRRLAENARLVPDEKGRVREKGVTPARARDAAVRMRLDRMLLRTLNAERIALESYTAEGLAENARFDFLVSACTLTAAGEPVFASVDEYQDRAGRGDEVAVRAAGLFAFLYQDLDPDFEKNLPENRYLESVGFFAPGDKPAEEETFELEPADPPAGSPAPDPAG